MEPLCAQWDISAPTGTEIPLREGASWWASAAALAFVEGLIDCCVHSEILFSCNTDECRCSPALPPQPLLLQSSAELQLMSPTLGPVILGPEPAEEEMGVNLGFSSTSFLFLPSLCELCSVVKQWDVFSFWGR